MVKHKPNIYSRSDYSERLFFKNKNWLFITEVLFLTKVNYLCFSAPGKSSIGYVISIHKFAKQRIGLITTKPLL
ncbi:hypothetical protein SAMN04488511_11132 [Pedobacter suwonensis]|uniref:Uncharacterized protein n=1 Tax=Pedobacter suwonensis TaxID=332999 RepID=A0A1I0TKU9_9SPHI|nr:hypothetical protein SAMN04488511_11132 [Pedobacter suwonensis]